MSSDSEEEKNYKEPALYYMNHEFEIGDIDNYLVEAKIGRGNIVMFMKDGKKIQMKK